MAGSTVTRRLACLGAAVWILASSSPALPGVRKAPRPSAGSAVGAGPDAADAAPTSVRVNVLGRVLSRSGTTIEVDRGSLDGLRADAADVIVHPLRKRAGETSRAIDAYVVLAGCKVQALRPESATLTLVQASGEVEVGDVISYNIQVPAALDDDPLFRVAARDARLMRLEPKEAIYTMAERLAQPTAESAAPIYERLLAEVKARIDLADKAYGKTSIPEGRFHGMSLSDAFRKTTVKDIEDFLVFIDGFPGKYIGQDWRLVEVYATWIINRTPSGENERMTRRLTPLVDRALALCGKGDLGGCEAKLREALRQWPDLTKAKTSLDSIDKIEAARRDLRLKPDDHAVRHGMMVALAGLGAWSLVLPEAETLIAASFKVSSCTFWRAVAMGELGRIDEAIALLETQLKTEGEGLWRTQMTKRLAMLRARKASGGKQVSAYSFADWMREVASLEAAGQVEEAQTKLLSARRAATTAAEFAEVGAATARLESQRAVRSQCASLKRDVESHEDGRMHERSLTLRSLAGQFKAEAAVAACLIEAADAARGVSEYAHSARLSMMAVELQPQSAKIHREAGWNLWMFKDLEAARKVITRATELDPSSHYAWHVLGTVQIALGNLDEAEAAETKAAEAAHYPWPRLALSRIAASRGDWAKAEELARKAVALEPESALIQTNLHHVLRLRAGHQAKAAGSEAARIELRNLRSWLWLELWPQAQASLQRLRGTPSYDAGCKSVASVTDRGVPIALLQRAAQDAQPEGPRDHVLRDRIAAEAALAGAGGAAERGRIRVASHYVREGRFHEALATVGGLAQKTKDPKLEREAADAAAAARRGLQAQATVDKANALRERGGALAEAEGLMSQALGEFEAIECWTLAANAAFYRAVMQASQGRVEDALKAMEVLQKRLARYLDPVGRLDLDWIQAGLLSWRGSLDATSKAVSAAIALCTAEDNDLCVEQMRIRRAGLLASEGRLAEAERDAAAALAFARERGFSSLRRQALFQLADTALVQGNLPKVQTLAAELLTAARASKDAINERLALMLHGAVAMRRGDVTNALAYFADVLRVGERMGDASIQAMAKLFEGYTQLDAAHNAKAAVPALQAAATFFQGVGDDYSVARARTGLGRAQQELGANDAAREVFAAVLDYAERVGRRVMIAMVHVELGHVELAAKHGDKALEHARRAVGIVESMDMDGQRANAKHVLGLALIATGSSDAGVAALKEATQLAAAEIARTGSDADQQGASGYGRSRKIFRDAIDALLKLGRAEEALEILQLSRDAALQRTFGKLKPKVADEATKTTVDGVHQAKNEAAAARKALQDEKAKPDAERSKARIAALGERIANSESRVRQLLFQLKKDHPRLHRLSTQVADPGALLRGRKALAAGTVIVATFAAENELFLFTIAKDRDGVNATRVPVGVAELRSDILGWRNAVLKRTPKASVLGRKLYDRLLGPIEADLAQADTVMIVPSGPLFYLPFGALEPKPGKFKYAIERWRFSTVVGETIVAMQNPVAKKRWTSFAAFANPDGSLPGAQAEVEKLASDVLRGVKTFFGAKAVADAVRDAVTSARVLHFATHGVLSGDGPESYLQLAGGHLTLDDIAGLELVDNVDLVVLSACQTAVALGENAEEGFSIADTFSRAGVPTLVASLWSVPDDATAELMVRFYKTLRAGGSSAAEALRSAQIELIKGKGSTGKAFSSPVHWAAFGLLGDPR